MAEINRDSEMWKDEIVEETRKAREEYAAKFNYDLEAIYSDLKKQEEHSRETLVTLPSKQPETIPHAKSFLKAPPASYH